MLRILSLKALAKTIISLMLETLGVACGLYSLRHLRDVLDLFPDGHGEPVLYIPGFGAGFETYLLLWAILVYKGYRPILWRPGRNWGRKKKTAEENLRLQVEEIFRKHGKIVIICHSAGYPYAAKMAHRYPEKIKMILSFGGLHNADNITNIHPGIRLAYQIITGESPETSWQVAKEDNVHIPPAGVVVIAVTGVYDDVLNQKVTKIKGSRKNWKVWVNIKIFARHVELLFAIQSWIIILHMLSYPELKFNKKSYATYFA